MKMKKENMSNGGNDQNSEDVKEEKFALLVGELTDISIEKHLFIAIRYYSKNN